METKTDETFEYLIDEIRDGNIDSWYEFEMKSTLNGLIVDSDLLLKLLNISSFLEIYSLIWNGMTETDAMDTLFEDGRLVDKIISNEGMMISYGYNGDKVEPIRFEGLKMLKSLDERNPRYMLKFFLHEKHVTKGGRYDAYFLAMLYDIIMRTKIRAKKLNVFEKYISRLETVFSEYKNIMFLCS